MPSQTLTPQTIIDILELATLTLMPGAPLTFASQGERERLSPLTEAVYARHKELTGTLGHRKALLVAQVETVVRSLGGDVDEASRATVAYYDAREADRTADSTDRKYRPFYGAVEARPPAGVALRSDAELDAIAEQQRANCAAFERILDVLNVQPDPLLASLSDPDADIDIDFGRIACGGFFAPVQCFAKLRRRVRGNVLFLAATVGGPPLADGLKEAAQMIGGADAASVQIVTHTPDSDGGGYALVRFLGNSAVHTFGSKESVAAMVDVEETFLDVPSVPHAYNPTTPPPHQDEVISGHQFATPFGDGVCIVKMRRALGKTLLLLGSPANYHGPHASSHLETVVPALMGEAVTSDVLAIVDATLNSRLALVHLTARGPSWHYADTSVLAAHLGVEEAFFDIEDLRRSGQLQAGRTV